MGSQGPRIGDDFVNPEEKTPDKRQVPERLRRRALPIDDDNAHAASGENQRPPNAETQQTRDDCQLKPIEQSADVYYHGYTRRQVLDLLAYPCFS